MKPLLVLLLALLLGACATSQQAPVIERAPLAKKPAPPKPAKTTGSEKDWRPDTYTVKKGDTLYGIGLEFGYDYKEIAQRNNIQPPYVIRVGQQLKIKDAKATPATNTAQANQEPAEAVATPLKNEAEAAPKTLDEPPLLSEPKALKEPYSEQAMAATKPAEPAKPVAKQAENATAPAKVEPAKTEPPAEKTASTTAADDEAVEWSWPANGKVLTNFNDAASAKGIDIAGSQGQPVLAAAPGKVVYSGSGLRGYGKLVIIKHNKTYLSAYAHNNQLLVKEGQEVVKGQKIAEMGSSDTDKVKLHFEIRKLGKPVDPSKYLPAS